MTPNIEVIPKVEGDLNVAFTILALLDLHEMSLSSFIFVAGVVK